MNRHCITLAVLDIYIHESWHALSRFRQDLTWHGGLSGDDDHFWAINRYLSKPVCFVTKYCCSKKYYVQAEPFQPLIHLVGSYTNVRIYLRAIKPLPRYRPGTLQALPCWKVMETFVHPQMLSEIVVTAEVLVTSTSVHCTMSKAGEACEAWGNKERKHSRVWILPTCFSLEGCPSVVHPAALQV